MKAVVALVCLLAAQALAHPTQEQDDLQNLAELKEDNDPCNEKDCGHGRECEVVEGKPICACAENCLDEEDDVMVCSTTNLTFSSECELRRQKCLCEEMMSGCEDVHHATLRIDYFSQCKEQEVCEQWEMEEFPKRVSHWFFLVLDELARRDDLNAAAKRMFEDSEKNAPHRLVFPVIWQFCELDVSHNSRIEVVEIAELTAMMKTQEKCTSEFLRKCDVDGEGTISIQEWGKCLGLDEDDIEDKCEELRA